MAHNIGFPKHIIQEMRNKKRQKQTKASTATHTQPILPQPKTWIKFIFHSPTIYKVTNLFKNANLKIAFRITNTIFQQFSQKPMNKDPPGVYRINCNTYKKMYIGQTGVSINTRHKEHVRYIKGNNPTSAYATHILHNTHEYGTVKKDATITETLPNGDKNGSLGIDVHTRV
jgi:hypothetical protein